ncbi:hypothetical protein ACVIGA_009086 [Bradyrhizobium sp. USDA 3240]
MAQSKRPTITQSFEFLNRQPRQRRLVGKWSFGCFIISLAVLVAIYWFQLGYVPGLIVAFICFLSLMHFSYASNSKLNQRMARMIDYWYLGVAAIGLFVFVLAYSGQRDLLFDRAVVAAYLLNEGEQRADMVKILAAISETMCRDKI